MNQSIDELEKLVSGIGAAETPKAVSIADPEPGTGEGDTAPNPNELRTYVDAVQLAEDLSIKSSGLDEAVRNQASMFAWYSQQAANARHQYERAKLMADHMTSKLSAHHRESLAAKGKTTEAQIEAAVKCDQRWIDANLRMIDARKIFDIANDSRAAFEQRKDMLVQVSVDRRTERQGELRIQGGMTVEEQRRQALAGIAQAQGQ